MGFTNLQVYNIGHFTSEQGKLGLCLKEVPKSVTLYGLIVAVPCKRKKYLTNRAQFHGTAYHNSALTEPCKAHESTCMGRKRKIMR